jgi:hypothetical protein
MGLFCHRGRGRSRVAGPAQLNKLCHLAAKFELAIVGVTDLGRATRGQFAYRPAGSRALTAAAQAAWGVLRHPRDRDRRVLLPLKMNMAKTTLGVRSQLVHDENGKMHWNWTLADVPADVAASETVPDGEMEFSRICAAG